jgi:hypothetical protein
MTNKKSTKMTALLVALVLITSLFMGVTIARYVTTTSSEDSARVAVWGINEGGTEMDLFNATYTADDGTTIAMSADDDNIIAPGTSKTSEFKILTSSAIKPEVMYEVMITVDDSEVADEIRNHPGIEWRVDNNDWGTWEELQTQIKSLVGNETGIAVFAPGTVSTELANGVKHTISWQWLMDAGYDVEDTLLGNKAVDGDISAKVVVEITARQTDVDSTGMLEGNGSVYNTNDPQPLTFRADADFSTFSNIEVDGTEVNPSNYEKEEGSIKIKLKKEYLQTLSKGDHKITINTADDRAIESKFTVTDSINIEHNGIIPEGGKYYVKEEGVWDDGWNAYMKYVGQYGEYKKLLLPGDKFPIPQTGDIYIYGDYEYRYNLRQAPSQWWSGEDVTQNGWSAFVIDQSKTTYKPIITKIANKELVRMDCTYMFCTNLTTSPIIPDTVVYAYSLFEVCPSLTGTVEINSSKLTDTLLFGSNESLTNPIELTGKSNKLYSIAAVYDKIIVKQPEIGNNTQTEHNKKIPKGGVYFVNVKPDNNGIYNPNKYTLYDAVYTEGETFPTPQIGDVYLYGDYEYRYNMSFIPGGWNKYENQNGWGVRVINETKSTYMDPLEKIANKPITSLMFTYAWNSNLTTSPKIPDTVTNLDSTYLCCSSLTGTVEINGNLIEYNEMFNSTSKPITLIGSSPQLSIIANQYDNVN